MDSPRTVVIGAGIGGLTVAALLRLRGHRVTVLEAHVYPGGCAGTFFHKGYQFDVGATLAGGFGPGQPHDRIARMLGISWPVHPVEPAWVVHLPGGDRVVQWSDPDRWSEERRAAFPNTEAFWRRQEMLADLSWQISSKAFPWPPGSLHDWLTVMRAVRPPTIRALPYLNRAIASLVPRSDERLKLFLDSQLIISAQTTSDRVDALYGSAALDLPRRGVNHVTGGIGALADTLVSWLRDNGAEVLFRQRVVEVSVDAAGRATAVRTDKKLVVQADNVVANLTPWALAELLGEDGPEVLREEVRRREPTWGAFTLYLGVDAGALPRDVADHHQVIVDGSRPLGEGNSVFISLGAECDTGRAPPGRRPMTLSTHTKVTPWWTIREEEGEEAYEERRAEYSERMLQAAELALPGLRRAIELELPGTPRTFEYFTRRPKGMVGGFPQESLFKARGPHTGVENLWLVGDSVFPGQSTAGVTMGALRVANTVRRA